MSGPTNSTEARYLDSDLDRVASGGKFRLAIYKHSSGTAGVVPYEDGSLPSALSELSGNGYSSPVVNDSGASASSQFSPAVPGDPTTKSGPSSGQWSFGTFTAAPQSGGEACVCIAVVDRVTRTSVSITTTQGSSTVTVSGTTVTNDDLGRALPTSLGIPAGCVIGSIIDSTHFTISKANAAVNADVANGTSPGTASVTLGEIVKYALPYFDPTATYTSPPNVTTVNTSDVVTFATALTGTTVWEGATITGTGIPANTVILAVAADGKAALLSKAATSSSTSAPTLTGKAFGKSYSTNDNPVIDGTNPLVIKTGDPKDPF